MDPRLGRSAFTINFSNPNAFVKKFPVNPPANQPTASSRGTKRNFDGLSLGLGNSSISDSSKQSMGTVCTVYSLGNEGTSRVDKRACDSRRALPKAGLDLELSLSVGPSQSAITGANFTAATTHNNTYLQPYGIEDSLSICCQHVGCGKGAQGGTNFCKAHGGGKRCTHPNCTKGAEGSTPFCKGHGGGKRCSAEGCTKSVRGGTQFCVAHGGGKRCVVEGCTKSARGRTDCCVGHGGGKRCKSAGCDKSAQGSTDFCKAHGGGKRCLWGHQGSDLGVGGPPCERLARGKKGLCVQHNPVLDDNRVHGGRTLGVFSALGHGDGPSNTETSRHSIFVHPVEAPHCVPLPTPEGRVHGGNNLSMFAISTNSAEASTSAPRNWKSTNDIQASTSSRRNWL